MEQSAIRKRLAWETKPLPQAKFLQYFWRPLTPPSSRKAVVLVFTTCVFDKKSILKYLLIEHASVNFGPRRSELQY